MQGEAKLARPAASPKVEQVEALSRAVSGLSLGNYPAIYAGFVAKGIPETAIKPRENVFTYQAWRALGRQVRRGEHGVKVVTFVEMAKENKETGEKQSFRRPRKTEENHRSVCRESLPVSLAVCRAAGRRQDFDGFGASLADRRGDSPHSIAKVQRSSNRRHMPHMRLRPPFRRIPSRDRR